MLDEWLQGELTIERFVDTCLGRVPMGRAGAASPTASALGWPRLDALLAHPHLDLLVAREGREYPLPPPRRLSELETLFADGLGIVIRRAERVDQTIAGIARALSGELAASVHVQLFASPAGTRTFGWHYDLEDVFLVQTAGTKTYQFRPNTVVDPRLDGFEDFGRIREETSPVMSCTLDTGDWFYLPRGWWHVARAAERSLHLSIGIARSPHV